MPPRLRGRSARRSSRTPIGVSSRSATSRGPRGVTNVALRLESLEPRLLLSASDPELPQSTAVGDDDLIVADRSTSDASTSSQPVSLAASSTTHIVLAGDDLQAVIDAAVPGDTIELQAGATFTGNFTLPNKVGAGWITIRGSAHASLPTGRVTAADAALMPKLVTPDNGAALRVQFGGHHYRIEGIEITSTAPVTQALVQIGYQGAYPSVVSEFASNITIDRSYIHAQGDNQVIHAIDASGENITLTNSEVSNIKAIGADSQAFYSGIGLSGYTIENNFLEASGENILFGGSNLTLGPFVPSYILIRGNSISKPNSWRSDHPDFAGTEWTVKNLIEFKAGRNVIVDGNVVENNWVQAQNGTGIQILSRNAEVENVFIYDNVFRNMRSLLSIAPQMFPLNNITFENNLAYDIEHNLFSIVSGPTFAASVDNVTIRNNTALFGADATNGLGNANLFLGDTTTVVSNFRYEDNILGAGEFGIASTSQTVGLPSIQYFADGFNVLGNQVVGAPSQTAATTYALGNPHSQGADYYGDFSLWTDVAAMGFANHDLLVPEHFDLSGNPGLAGKGADIAAILAAIDLPPAVARISANGQTAYEINDITASSNGLFELKIEFSRPVVFAATDVSVQEVTFPGGVETLGNVVAVQSVTGSGTDTMTLTFAPGTVVDTWVQVTLHDTIVDLAGEALDGESTAIGPGLSVLADADADLPTGNHLEGGNTIFYSGNLVGDLDGSGSVAVTDILTAFSNTTGPNPAPPNPPFGMAEFQGDFDGDTDIDVSDLLVLFTVNGNSLDPLVLPGGGLPLAGFVGAPTGAPLGGALALAESSVQQAMTSSSQSISTTSSSPQSAAPDFGDEEATAGPPAAGRLDSQLVDAALDDDAVDDDGDEDPLAVSFGL
ncbi:MAG: right-handed parallel beta-helix repeat-containing protein [Planctomycetota bacterium]|nr:MAG: right-handed parallel beta-helix repeat-containing protein [Planctomycetota bacterium]REJ95912.1 MAG: right-handed parallel beta-helix repeat-containing protein [Planctomycetota bacterium]